MYEIAYQPKVMWSWCLPAMNVTLATSSFSAKAVPVLAATSGLPANNMRCLVKLRRCARTFQCV